MILLVEDYFDIKNLDRILLLFVFQKLILKYLLVVRI